MLKSLSKYLSISVDFAKHGKCVPKDIVTTYQLFRYPIYLESKHRSEDQQVDRNNILAILFNSSDPSPLLSSVQQSEHSQSINLNYTFTNSFSEMPVTHLLSCFE